MPLVGASNTYITLPFMFEAIISAISGAALACATMTSGVYFIVIQKAAVSPKSLPWIGWHQATLSMTAVAIVGLLLSIIPTLITTRKYLTV